MISVGDRLSISSHRAQAREVLLNGPEGKLPDGIFFRDNDGHDRDEARLNWWLFGQPGLSWAGGREWTRGKAGRRLPYEQLEGMLELLKRILATESEERAQAA